MANDDIARGFVPLNLNYSKSVHYYLADTGDDVFMGQPVKLNPSGYVVGTSGQAVEPILGIAVGFAGLNKSGLPSDDPFLDVSDVTDQLAAYIAVADDPATEFVVQGDTGATLMTRAAFGSIMFDVNRGATVTVNSGNITTGWSSLELDQSTAATTSAGTYQVLRLHDQLNTDGTENTTGNYVKLVVRIYHHQKIGGQQALGIV